MVEVAVTFSQEAPEAPAQELFSAFWTLKSSVYIYICIYVYIYFASYLLHAV